ncbi:MFS transporter [Streptantibioticus silvisoli]|uniref:MFS transporter n=1 Tax=Streptantibioticus silvisoli TaxID=2705255 RepID=A0ABT6VXY7_9ACTN|nr:MFS transporter [Streptantibioticus silvisoli]MDI5962121.1 MFS transporter [Streptantibioticus silvisoli]
MTTAMGAALRRIQLGNALSAFGNGFTVPFLFVYVAQVRGLGSGTAGVVLSAFAVSALLVLPFTGRSIDSRGPLPVVVVGSLVSAVGSFGLGMSSDAALAVVSSAVLGAGIAVIQPALATLIVWCSSPATRSRAFASQFFLQNLGLGIGGLIGGLIVDVSRPATFTRLFVIEATMFVVLAAIVATVRLPRVPRMETAPGEAAAGGWRAMLAHRSMVRLCVLGAVMFFACYGQFESGLPAFATQVTHIAPATLGVALAANTAVIVVAQFLVLRPVERRRRSRVIAMVGLVWAAAWGAAGLAGLVHGHQAWATAAIISTYALFGLGESLLSPTVSPLVADLAPSGLVGQYNAAFALVKQLALAVGPAAGGAMAAAGLYGIYIPALVVISLGVTVLALRMGRGLGTAEDLPAVRRPAVPAQELASV